MSAPAGASKVVKRSSRGALLRAVAASLALCACATAPAADVQRATTTSPGEYVPPTPLALDAYTARAFSAPEADQGVAVDRQYFYAIDNSTIAKYSLVNGALIARWQGPSHGLIRHLNSCFADGGRLYCANSNYSLTPMGSSVEIFDAGTLTHVDSHSLGMTDEGSLTWFDRLHRRGWIAGFAHYDGNGGVGFKDHRFSGIVTFDSSWRRTGGWLLPDSVLERMAPHAASGGAIGPDGLLYVLGHDRPELYVLARPRMGPTLLHVATIAIEAEGQAFAWAPGGERRIFAIDRRAGRVLEISIPTVDVSSFRDARTFR